MKIQQENIDQLNAVLNITLTPEDYKDNYEKALKDYTKRAALPGFRPGKVPATVIKKRFGKSLLAEEINKTINDAITSHIQDNKLEVLGNPLPRHNEADGGDWENPADFNFSYDLGLTPQFEIKLSKADKHNFHLIKVDAAMIDRQVGDMARRYGKLSTPEVAEDKDLIVANLAELDENGAVLEDGINADTTISLEYIKDEKVKANLLGLVVDATVKVNPAQLAENAQDLMRMLSISQVQAEQLGDSFLLTVKELRRMAPADLNQELFDKVLGKDTVSSEAEFRAKIEEQLKSNFVSDSNRLFKRDITEHLLSSVQISLPDDFLKRWIMASNDRPISAEQLEIEYPSYANGLKWQLIENKIFQEGGIQIENEDLVGEAKAMMAEQFARYGIPIDNEEMLVQSAQRLLGNKEEMKYVYEQVAEKKMMGYIKENVALVETEVSFDDFVVMAQKGASN